MLYFSQTVKCSNSHIQRWQKEVWDGGKIIGGLGMGVLQRGPGAEPR